MVKSISKLICVCIHNIHIHNVCVCVCVRERERERERETQRETERETERTRWWAGLGGKRTNHTLEQISVEYAPRLLGEWIDNGAAKAKAIHLLAPTAPQRSPGKTLPNKTHLCE